LSKGVLLLKVLSMLTRNYRALVPLVLLGLLCFSRTASAQLFVYTSQSSYNAAQFPTDTIEFDGLTTGPNGDTSYGDPGTLNVGGVSFTTPTGTALNVIGPAVSAGAFNFPNDGTPVLFVQNQSGAGILSAALPTNLPLGVSAVGTQISDAFAASSITATLTFSNGSTATYVYSAPNASTSGLGFLGFVAQGVNITSISYSDPATILSGSVNNGSSLTLDNFTYGTINTAGIGTPVTTLAVPEPTTLPLIGVGAFALFYFRRRLAVR
jgi:hypothetical protein